MDGSEERNSTHAGLEFHGEHLVDSWVASDLGEAEIYGIVDGSARGIFTKAHLRGDGTNRQHRRRNGLYGIRSGCVPTGVRKTRHIQVRWLWIQDAIRDKVVRLRKVRGNEAEWETKTSTDRHISVCCRNCRSSQPSADGLLGLIATANGGSVVETQMNGNEETLGKFSAQVMIVTPQHL